MATIFVPEVAQAQATRSYCAELSVTTSTSTPFITLNWPTYPNVTAQTLWVRQKGTTTWTAISLSSTATSYADTNASAGVAYEYSFKATASASPWAIYGSIMAGYNIPLVEGRGKVIVLVDNTVATALTPELTQLQRNMIADGWTIYRHDVARMAVDPSTAYTSSVGASRLAEIQAVRTLVQADYNTAPGNDWALFILGRVPIPYSGEVSPDGHGNRAWPTDAYYADVDGNWTDTSLNDTSWSDGRSWNVPGDGKLDQSVIPSKIELQSGRVDLSNMTDVPNGMTELQLLRQYLVRDHRFRRGLAPYDVVARRALIEDNFNGYGGMSYGFAADAWRLGFAFFGRNAGQTDAVNRFPSVETMSVLFAANYASAGYDFIGSNNSYSYFSKIDFNFRNSKAVFSMDFGSFHGDWDSAPDNYLRAPLAGTQDSLGLCSMWSGWGYFQLFHMALGETIGYGVRFTQNMTSNTGDWVQSDAGITHQGWVCHQLMGDPTLRLHTVVPPSKVTAVSSTGQIALSWAASTDASVLGYQVYRSTSTAGPFTRVSGVATSGTNPTGSPITATTFTDTDSSLVSGTTYAYQVKAVKMETTPSGTYANQSLGESVAVTHLAATPAPLAPTRLSVSRTDATTCVLTWDDNATNETGYLVERYSPTAYTWSQIASLGANVTTYTDNASGTAGKTVYYRVRAAGGSGNSAYSNEVADWNLAGLIYAPKCGYVTTKSANTLAIQAMRYDGSAGSVGVSYVPSDVYSTAGVDYVTPSTNVTWAHGESGTKSGNLTILSPTGTQPTKVVKITYANTTNGAVTNAYRPYSLVYIADPAAQVLPSPWATTTFGSYMVGDDGYAETAKSTYGILTRTGNFVGGSNEDSIRFLYQPINGDFTFTANMALQAPTKYIYTPIGVYGLMLRSSLASSSAMSSIYMTGNPAVVQLSRTTSNSASGSATTISWGSMNRWLRMVRSGSNISTYQSNDGTTWTQVGSTTTLPSLPSTIYLGYFAAGNAMYTNSPYYPNDPTQYSYARFESMSLAVTPYSTVDNIATFTAAPGTNAGEASINWSVTNGATSYLIERSTLSNSGFVQVAAVPYPATSYTDKALSGSTTYYYRAMAVNSGYQSAYSTVVSTAPYVPAGISGWRYIYFNSTNAVAGTSGDLDTPAKDGFTNLMAYALGGLNPLTYKSPTSLPYVQTQTVSGDYYLTCSFTHNTTATDLQIRVEVASDVNGPWTSLDPFAAANQVSVTGNSPSVGQETIVVKDTQPISTSNKRFMRFKVTRP